MLFHSGVLTSFRSSALSSSPPPIGFLELTGANLGATLATGGLWGAGEIHNTQSLTSENLTVHSKQIFTDAFVPNCDRETGHINQSSDLD